MPIPLAIPLIASAVGSGITAFGQANAAKRNLRAQQEQQRQINQGAAANSAQINNQLGSVANMLQSLATAPFNSQQADPTAFSFDPITGAQINAPSFNAATAGQAGDISADMLNLDSIFSGSGSRGFNTGQDALMQFLRADPTGKMAGSNGVLQEIAETGLPSNLTEMFGAAANVNRDNNAEILANVAGQSRSVGQRFGSATRRLEGDTARRLANEQSLQNSQLALQAGEAAAGRRLGAASQLGQFQLQGAGQLLNAGQAERQLMLQGMLANQGASMQAQQFNAGQFNQNQQFNAGAQNQVGAQNAQMMLQSLLNNQQSTNQANMFNVNTGLQANQVNNAQAMQAIFGNNQQMLGERTLQQNALGQAGNVTGQQMQLLNQLLGIRASQPVPQMNMQAAGAMGGSLMDLGSLMTAFNRYGAGSGGVPTVPNVNIPRVDIGPISGANLGQLSNFGFGR